jgi:hypothetical protein
MNIRTTTAFATGAIFALVLGTGTAYAANGGNFKLGGNNYESREASLNNSGGTALTLRSKAGTPSLKVNRTTKVPNLNADMIDGVDSSGLARRTSAGTVIGAGFLEDDVIVAEAYCPAGSQVMGGGAYDGTDGIPYQSTPMEGVEGWVVASTGTPTEENAALVEAHARCWNPGRDVTDNLARKAPSKLSLSAKRQMAGTTRAR